MTDEKIQVKKVEVRVKLYHLIEDAVERGINRGWNRAHKHTDAPTEEMLKDQLNLAVMGEICELIDFQDTE